MEILSSYSLQKNPLFQNLDLEERKRIFGLAEKQNYNAGDFVFQEGEEATKLFVVESGLVGIVVQLGPGNELTIVTESEGGAFGWAAVLPPHRYTASAKCFQPSQLLALEGAKLREICHREPRFGVKFMEGLACFIAVRLRNTNLALLNAFLK